MSVLMIGSKRCRITNSLMAKGSHKSRLNNWTFKAIYIDLVPRAFPLEWSKEKALGTRLIIYVYISIPYSLNKLNLKAVKVNKRIASNKHPPPPLHLDSNKKNTLARIN